MSRSDLLEVNGKIINEVSETIRNGSPDAFVIVVTNPLDSMVHLARAKTGFPGKRVVGMAGVLDSARFSWFIAEATKSSVVDVDAMVLGAHGDSMVPMTQYCTANGVQLKDLVDTATIDKLADRTRNGGAEIVNLLKTGSAWYAPASAAVAMAASILLDQKRMLPCACFLNGQFGFEGIYMGVPAILGKEGVEKIVEVPLDNTSRAQMQKTAGAVMGDVQLLRDLRLLWGAPFFGFLSFFFYFLFWGCVSEIQKEKNLRGKLENSCMRPSRSPLARRLRFDRARRR